MSTSKYIAQVAAAVGLAVKDRWGILSTPIRDLADIYPAIRYDMTENLRKKLPIIVCKWLNSVVGTLRRYQQDMQALTLLYGESRAKTQLYSPLLFRVFASTFGPLQAVGKAEKLVELILDDAEDSVSIIEHSNFRECVTYVIGVLNVNMVLSWGKNEDRRSEELQLWTKGFLKSMRTVIQSTVRLNEGLGIREVLGGDPRLTLLLLFDLLKRSASRTPKVLYTSLKVYQNVLSLQGRECEDSAVDSLVGVFGILLSELADEFGFKVEKVRRKAREISK